VQQQAGPDGFRAFLPAPLPPEPPVALTGDLAVLLERASHALGRLDGVSAAIDPGHLLYVYVRKEAVLSSQIEGTNSTLSDLLQYEAEGAPGVPVDDVREVSRYVAALHHGIARMRAGMPLSLRLVRELHGVLMAEGRGSHQAPGEFRRTQNWIGGSRPGTARFVPPPVPEMEAALGNLEAFLNDVPARTAAPLIKAGLAHAQFETIHPFLDGNGRVGRLLITCVLHAEQVLAEPVLYLSLYFRQRRAEYYDALQRVRTDGDWEGWLAFYLDGVAVVAEEAASTARALLALEAVDRARVQGLGKGAASALAVFDLLRQRVVTSIARAAAATELTIPTVTAALGRLERLGIVRETTGRRYGRQFVYGGQLDLLDRGLGTAREQASGGGAGE
jgi:Fic family protein